MPKLNPNIRAEYERALTVSCPFCKVGIGKPCWTLKPWKGGPVNVAVTPHKIRIKAAWRTSYGSAKNRIQLPVGILP